MSDKKAMWRSRVAAWRASGETAETFAAVHGFMVGTLRWWSSRLQREAGKPEVRLARVVRTTAKPEEPGTDASGRLVIDLLDFRARVDVQGRVDRATLVIVLTALREAAR